MEILLALAGALGLAALLQQKPLPSADDAVAALAKLDKNPDDPDANTVVGKYEAFVLGDYNAALPHLVKSSDKTLKELAVHELDPNHVDTSHKMVGMGDEWVTAAKKFPALYRIFFDRASYWYIKAFDLLDPVWKLKVREQGQKLSAARPPGSPRKALPTAWMSDAGIATLDGTIAHVGSYSVRLSPDLKNPGSESFLKSAPIPVAGGKKLEFSAYVRSDGTDDSNDQFFINWFNADGKFVGALGPGIPVDLPFWSRISAKVDVPPAAATARVGGALRSRKGSAWIDDVSVKLDGKEILKNPSFEER